MLKIYENLPFARIDLWHLWRTCGDLYSITVEWMLPFPDNSREDTSWPLSSDSVAL